ncbi:MAG TPA: acyl carrier protein [Kineosporiaceae bacterium]
MSTEMTSLHPLEHDQMVSVIATALSAVLERDLGEVTGSTRLFDEIGLDSTGLLDLLMHLEESLGIELAAEELELEHFATCDALAGFLLAQQGS